MTNNCGNVYHLEDRTIKKRVRDLFYSINPSINRAIDGGQTDLTVRMEPIDIDRLKKLITEAGDQSPIIIAGFGRRYAESAISNGTLGPTQPVDLQIETHLHVLPTLEQD